MATRTTVVRENDFTKEAMGSDEGATVEFTWKGVTTEIDLYHDQIEELDTLLAPYVDAGRRVTQVKSVKSTASKSSSGPRYGRETSRHQREWARANGWPELKDRGRVPNDVIEAWEQAHQGAAA